MPGDDLGEHRVGQGVSCFSVWRGQSSDAAVCEQRARIYWPVQAAAAAAAGQQVGGRPKRSGSPLRLRSASACSPELLVSSVPTREDPSALVTMFATYFCWSALIAQPAAACKPADSSLNGSVDMAVEALLGSVAFISAANAASASTDGSAYMAPPRMGPRCDELARECVPAAGELGQVPRAPHVLPALEPQYNST